MPQVGAKKFPYTPAGKKAAKKAADKQGAKGKSLPPWLKKGK